MKNKKRIRTKEIRAESFIGDAEGNTRRCVFCGIGIGTSTIDGEIFHHMHKKGIVFTMPKTKIWVWRGVMIWRDEKTGIEEQIPYCDKIRLIKGQRYLFDPDCMKRVRADLTKEPK